MALSRAAAAAARKAAKNRGLQGNRGADGSLRRADDLEHSSGDPRYTVGPDTDQLNFYEGLAREMSDDELIKAYKKAESDLIELEIQEKSTGQMNQNEYATAKEKLKAFEDELDARDTGEFRESNEPYDTEEEISPGFKAGFRG